MTVKTFQVVEDLDLVVGYHGVRGATKRYIEDAVAVSSDDSVATVRVEGDVVVVTPHKTGTCTVTVTADAQEGEGVKPVSGTFAVEVVAAQADRIEFSDSWTADKTVEAAPAPAVAEAPVADEAAPAADVHPVDAPAATEEPAQG